MNLKQVGDSGTRFAVRPARGCIGLEEKGPGQGPSLQYLNCGIALS